MSEPKLRRTPERKVLGDLGNTKAEPVSPTANLRLLTSLASNLKNAVDPGDRGKPIAGGNDTPIAGNADNSKLLPRKQKSLGLLCDKFLSLYPLAKSEGSAPQEISLDGTARALGTEKRRIYDIINVLESLEMATKAGKNRYLWHGQSGLVATLIKFKSLAIKLGLREQIREIQRINKAYTGDNCEDSPSTWMDNALIFDDIDEDTSGDAAIREDKSLGAMCQKFVMLFLISLKNGVINLDIAAKVLITDVDNRISGSADESAGSRFKTKVRRLYDIANVLSAIGLIKKIYMYDRTIRKPVFKYIGPDIDYVDLDGQTPGRDYHQGSVNHATTPNKSCDLGERSVDSASSTTTRYEFFIDHSTVTPVNDKRKPRKRKLFAGESSFVRTHSSPCLDESKSRALERMDDSILRVAEMELEKLNSIQDFKPKACTKLFSRYNSDSCISKDNHEKKTIDSTIESKRTVTNVPHLIVSKENVFTATASPLQVSTASLVTRPMSDTVKTVKTVKTLARKLVPLRKSASPICAPTTLVTRVTHYKIEPKAKLPKIVNLTCFDPKKLIPIKRSDLNISLTPINPIVIDPTRTPGFAILTRIPAPSIVSPGDTFKAVKVGNTLQLVPLKNYHSTDNANREDGRDSGNPS